MPNFQQTEFTFQLFTFLHIRLAITKGSLNYGLYGFRILSKIDLNFRARYFLLLEKLRLGRLTDDVIMMTSWTFYDIMTSEIPIMMSYKHHLLIKFCHIVFNDIIMLSRKYYYSSFVWDIMKNY